MLLDKMFSLKDVFVIVTVSFRIDIVCTHTHTHTRARIELNCDELQHTDRKLAVRKRTPLSMSGKKGRYSICKSIIMSSVCVCVCVCVCI